MHSLSNKAWIIVTLVSKVVAASSSGQVVLKTQDESQGVMRRYEITEEILNLVQSDYMDVWWRNRSHIDVYFPNPPLNPKWETLTSLSQSQFPLISYITSSKQREESWNLTTLANCKFHDVYHPLFEIDYFMEQLAREFPEFVELKRLGHSAEGREMYAVFVRKKTFKKKKEVKKQAVVIQGAQHAREWIATATAAYLAHALVVDSSQQFSMTHMLDFYDFYITPSPNPDGYEYTWSEDRFWYKNRMPLGPSARCQGLDMNRNWGFHWLADGDTSSLNASNTQADTCSHWYPGSRPFEAPEVNNLANFVTSIPRKVAFLDLRSYGQMISIPFSYTCDILPDAAEDLLEAALGAAAAMKKVWGTHTSTGTLCEMLYSAPGNVVDWMYSVADIKYSYAVHLRDTGTFGYALPPNLIRPTGQETAKMAEYLINFIRKRGF